LAQDGSVLASAQSSPRRAHGGRLLVEIDELLRANERRIDQVDLFAASAGPGSFTGVRVGLATIRALAWSNQRPCTALNTLDVLAHSAVPQTQWLSPVVDARKQEVYAALYRIDDGDIRQVIPPIAVDPGEWLNRVQQHTQAAVQFVGSGIVRYPEKFERGDMVSMDCAPEASALALLVSERVVSGGMDDLPPAVPCYIRPSEAEVKFGAAPALDIDSQIAAYDDSTG